MTAFAATTVIFAVFVELGPLLDLYSVIPALHVGKHSELLPNGLWRERRGEYPDFPVAHNASETDSGDI